MLVIMVYFLVLSKTALGFPSVSLPCTAEALKVATTYTCDRNGTVICHHGWSDVETLCSIPVCSFQPSGGSCVHGSCTGPNQCACEVGYEGPRCEKCIPLPGCIHGHCLDQAFQCTCHDESRWKGEHCDEPICQDCQHGTCQSPGNCV